MKRKASIFQRRSFKLLGATILRAGRWFPKNIARLINVRWFEVKAEITCSLRPGAYTVSWRAHLSADAQGWDSEPVHFSFSKNEAEPVSECKCYIDGTRSGAPTPKEQPTIRGVGNGWTEYNLGEFVVAEGEQAFGLKLSMAAVGPSLKSGLTLDGVFIRPQVSAAADPIFRRFLSSLSNAAPFVYRPLLAREIRLLHVLPGKGPDDICCTIVHCASPPVYEALSYTWGNAAERTNILCNGKRMAVTRNLAVALRALRRADRERVLWVDAVCINQSDDGEKSVQVGMMRDIYLQAWGVVAWVGERDDRDEAALNIGSYLNLARGDTSSEELITWLSLVTFIKRPWFSRVWIVQELAVARRLTFYCGQREVEWDVLRRGLSKFLERMGLFLNTSKADVCLERVFTLLSIRNLVTEHSEEHRVPESLYYEFPLSHIDVPHTRVQAGDLLRFVRSTRLFGATNPSDHIFALLGLVLEEDRKGVEITYSRDYTYVYREFVRVMIVQHGALDVLSQAGLHRAPALPSWVPDWSIPLKSYPLNAQAYSASGASLRLKSMGPAAFQKVLPLHGIVVDTIKSLTPGLIVSDTAESEVFERSALATFKGCLSVEAILDGESFRKALEVVPSAGETVRTKPEMEKRWHQAAQLCEGTYPQWESVYIQTLIGNLRFKQLGPSHDALLYDCFLIWRERLKRKVSVMLYGSAETSVKVKPELRELFSRHHDSTLSTQRAEGKKKGLVQVNSDPNHPWFANEHLVKLFKRVFKPRNGAPVATYDADDRSVKLGIARMFSRTVERLARNRHFCTTNRGLMGWVPFEAESGDVVCVLEGGRVPYILRPDERRAGLYRFVGEAYVHGLMHGEGLVGQAQKIFLI